MSIVSITKSKGSIEALERFADSHKSRATVDEDANIVKEMKHAMSVMKDKAVENEEMEPPISKDEETELGVSEKAKDVEKADEEEVEDTKGDKENKVDKVQQIEDLLAAPKPTVIKDSEDTSPLDVSSGTELVRNPSETPSSEINLQFPPSPSKRPRRDDDQHIRSAGADVLLPMLIFTVVKSNPHQFVSNLKFIQRYRMASKISGEASYCLTNMVSGLKYYNLPNRHVQ